MSHGKGKPVWHRCERWWRAGLPCAVGGEAPPRRKKDKEKEDEPSEDELKFSFMLHKWPKNVKKDLWNALNEATAYLQWYQKNYPEARGIKIPEPPKIPEGVTHLEWPTMRTLTWMASTALVLGLIAGGIHTFGGGRLIAAGGAHVSKAVAARAKNIEIKLTRQLGRRVFPGNMRSIVHDLTQINQKRIQSAYPYGIPAGNGYLRLVRAAYGYGALYGGPDYPPLIGGL